MYVPSEGFDHPLPLEAIGGQTSSYMATRNNIALLDLTSLLEFYECVARLDNHTLKWKCGGLCAVEVCENFLSWLSICFERP